MSASQKREGKGGKGRSRADGAREEEQDDSGLRRLWDQVAPIALAILIALAIRAVVIESYYVPSGSMLPTMFIGDHVFVSKFAFGAHIPLLGWTAPALRDPERGEIIVFALGRTPQGQPCPLDQCPGSPSEGFVKRLVGLPGDTVEYRDGNLILNGKVVEAKPLDEEFTDENGVHHRVLEEDLDGCRHRVLDRPNYSGMNQAPYTVPENRYFMMGDNRDNSNDSRGWGTVRRDDLKGPVLFNYWSWNNDASWLQMLNPFTWIRLLWSEMYWDRIGTTYDCRSS